MSPNSSKVPSNPSWLTRSGGAVWHEVWRGVLGAGITVGLGILAAFVISPLIQSNLTPPSCDDPKDLRLVARSELSAEATSTNPPEEGATYEAPLAIDGDSSTAWVEGISDSDPKKYGEDETLTIKLKHARDVQLICVINGYTSTLHSYQLNSRVRQLTVETEAGSSDSVLPEKPLEFYEDYQSVNFAKGLTKSIALTIGTARAGQLPEREPDTSISEVEIWAKAQ